MTLNLSPLLPVLVSAHSMEALQIASEVLAGADHESADMSGRDRVSLSPSMSLTSTPGGAQPSVVKANILVVELDQLTAPFSFPLASG
jgi:hypothetical protein